jgi:hypothetical protein
LKVERLLQPGQPELGGLAMAFGGNGVSARVLSLLDPRRDGGHFGAMLAAFALLLTGLLAVSAPLHHITESVLGRLTH